MVVSLIEILELLSDVELDVDLYVGANVQEVGLRGAKPAAELIQPDVALIVGVHLRMILKV